MSIYYLTSTHVRDHIRADSNSEAAAIFFQRHGIRATTVRDLGDA